MIRWLHRRAVVAVVASLVAAPGCAGTPDAIDAPDRDREETTVEVGSPDLADGGTIPAQFTCDGDDAVPALAWTGLPEDTDNIAVVVDDPDAPGGTFTHWMAWGIDPAASPLASDVPRPATQGTNDFGSVGYRGPCPPEGDEPHHYRFRILALDAPLDLAEGASPDEVAAAVDGHVLAEGQLTATYGR